tara:strand:- start:18439 stop:20442 length:2004 start_codon:yes stop_codon:yes gene_type:complete
MTAAQATSLDNIAGGSVSSFNTRSGTVVPLDGDYSADLIPISVAGVTANRVEAAIAELNASIGTSAGIYISILNHGAVGDDSTLNDSAFSSAIAAAFAAGGGTVFIPAGIYRVNGQISVGSSNIHVIGAGADVSIIKQMNVTSNTLVFGAGIQYVRAEDFSITAGVIKTSGKGLSINATSFSTFSKMKIEQHAGQIEINTAIAIALTDLNLRDVSASEPVITVNGGNDHFFTRVVADNDSGNESSEGVLIVSSVATWMTDCDFINCGTALRLRSDNGEITWGFFNHIALDSSNGHGISIEATNNRIVGCQFSDGWCATNTGSGINIPNSGAQLIQSMRFSGWRCYNNAGHGANVERGSHITFDACEMTGNSVLSPNANSGFNIGAGASDWAVRSCRSGQSAGFGNTQARGITINNGASDRYIITGNDFNGNVAASLFDGGTGAEKVISGNLPLSVNVNPSAGVDSWNGRTGAVVPANLDYDGGQVTYTGGGGISASNVNAAILETYNLANNPPAAGVASFNGRVGAVIPTNADYNGGQVVYNAGGGISATNVNAAILETYGAATADTGWQIFSLAGTPTAGVRNGYRRRNGIVYIQFSYNGGARSQFQTIASVPVGFRPSEDIDFVAMDGNETGTGSVVCSINTSGNVIIRSPGTHSNLSGQASFPI